MAFRVVIPILLLALTACTPATVDPEPTTPAEESERVETTSDTEMVKALEELAARPPAPVEKHGKPALGDAPSPEKMCSRGRCPSGYRCGSMPGRPRKVCYAAEAHRAGPSKMFGGQ